MATRNPVKNSPVEVDHLSHYLRSVLVPSQVVSFPDFWLPSQQWLVNGLYLLINGIYWGYNQITNHLLTSWDIQVWPFFALSLTTEVLSLAIVANLMENIGYLSTNTHGEARQQLKSRSKGDLKAEEPPASLDFKLTLPRKTHAICVGFSIETKQTSIIIPLVFHIQLVFFSPPLQEKTQNRACRHRIISHGLNMGNSTVSWFWYSGGHKERAFLHNLGTVGLKFSMLRCK